MSTTQYIPAGRTSRVMKGESVLQVQTEYAVRPQPRITTTIICSGRVLQKVERSLEAPVMSFDEQRHVEIIIKQQHAEICSILDSKAKKQPQKVAPKPEQPPARLTPEEQILRESGVKRVFRVDNEGTLVASGPSEEFKKALGPVLRHLRELIEIFVPVPGIGSSRETGVYEVERDHLYLLSLGLECLIVLVDGPPPEKGFEERFRKLLLKLG